MGLNMKTEGRTSTDEWLGCGSGEHWSLTLKALGSVPSSTCTNALEEGQMSPRGTGQHTLAASAVWEAQAGQLLEPQV